MRRLWLVLVVMLAGCRTEAEEKRRKLAADERVFFERAQVARAEAEAAKPEPPKPEILKFDTDKEMRFWERVYAASIVAIRDGGMDYRRRLATENADLAVLER